MFSQSTGQLTKHWGECETGSTAPAENRNGFIPVWKDLYWKVLMVIGGDSDNVRSRLHAY